MLNTANMWTGRGSLRTGLKTPGHKRRGASSWRRRWRRRTYCNGMVISSMCLFFIPLPEEQPVCTVLYSVGDGCGVGVAHRLRSFLYTEERILHGVVVCIVLDVYAL